MAYRSRKKSRGSRSYKRPSYSRSNKRGGAKRGSGRRARSPQTIRIVVEQPQSTANLPFDVNGKLQSETPTKKSKF